MWCMPVKRESLTDAYTHLLTVVGPVCKSWDLGTWVCT